MKLINHSNGVVYYVSDKIKSPHAFATRLGGASKNEHTRSLNLAFGRGDEKDVVLENLRIYCEAVGIEAAGFGVFIALAFANFIIEVLMCTVLSPVFVRILRIRKKTRN